MQTVVRDFAAASSSGEHRALISMLVARLKNPEERARIVLELTHVRGLAPAVAQGVLLPVLRMPDSSAALLGHGLACRQWYVVT